jgi:hypothetical protein
VPDKNAVFTVFSVEVSAPRDEPDPRGKRTDTGTAEVPVPPKKLKVSLHAA